MSPRTNTSSEGIQAENERLQREVTALRTRLQEVEAQLNVLARSREEGYRALVKLINEGMPTTGRAQ